MSVIFALRGNSLVPRYAAGLKSRANYLSNLHAANPGAVVNLGHASVFGGQAIDLIALGDTRAIIYSGGANWITGSNIFSALFRVVPNWTGNPAGVRRIVQIGGSASPAWAGGMLLEIQTDGKLFCVARDASDKGTVLFSFTTASALSFTSGQATDIMIVSDGTRVYVSQEGVEIHDGALTSTAAQLGAIVAGGIRLGPYPWDGYYNEVVFWNSAEPHEYSPRTDFISVADFEGLAAPSAGQVKIGEVVIGVTGTYDGSDRWTSPQASDYLATAPALKSNSLTTNLTGTLVADSVDPGEDKVLLGHPYRILGADKVGTLSHFRVDPDPGTSKITAGLQALKTALSTIFPSGDGWQYLINPYRPEENPESHLRLGYGVALGNGRSENLQICAQYDVNRAFTVVLTRKFEGTKSDADGKEDVAVQLLEDQRELINALEQNPTLGGAIMYTQYQGDGGIEFVNGQKDNYLMVRTVLSFQYIENFV